MDDLPKQSIKINDLASCFVGENFLIDVFTTLRAYFVFFILYFVLCCPIVCMLGVIIIMQYLYYISDVDYDDADIFIGYFDIIMFYLLFASYNDAINIFFMYYYFFCINIKKS